MFGPGGVHRPEGRIASRLLGRAGRVRLVRVEVSFEHWVVGVFGPTVEDPWPPPAQERAHVTRLFSDPVGALEALSDEEKGVGLWSVLDSGGAGRRWPSTTPTSRSMIAAPACG